MNNKEKIPWTLYFVILFLLIILFGCTSDPLQRSALDFLNKPSVPNWCDQTQNRWGKACAVECPIYRTVYLNPMEATVLGHKRYFFPSSRDIACDIKKWDHERDQIRLNILDFEQKALDRQR